MSIPSWIIRHQKLLCDLYDRQPLALDMLPYTNEFEKGICKPFIVETGENVDHKEVWRALIILRKNLRVLPTKKKESDSQTMKKYGLKGFKL